MIELIVVIVILLTFGVTFFRSRSKGEEDKQMKAAIWKAAICRSRVMNALVMAKKASSKQITEGRLLSSFIGSMGLDPGQNLRTIADYKEYINTYEKARAHIEELMIIIEHKMTLEQKL